ncbi:tRNA (5-methylaminomethyl-2-thiouridylate)-methyltransferase [Sulfurimonas gotlandica GD1]|uniref:tRNA-specific 2-thiouridylase MnmA n=1 Tax=Sulfurimonas gotlandica (strain DSM 19862 / JCM 16533 / GD1) TaxID=929558 RepID=B6BNE9_SULGG|nr:tRNA 2-thiouridine(34) synthase MnmA [Sulfurimonas gotlandica]EDZ61439.1 tRNA (5-methylaminomethyl-2-thiouridylate)-methyltransferase [Sulfurimonas gotlandica GD1]EHP31019.1 tRNA (5-methylaminomethyl-2-thiouridylate)-methyltransferase [Sulfurimonas gotlandica GD1]
MNKKVIVGMSGGIDSSVTAYLLQQEGYEVIGVYMKLHDLIENFHEDNIASGKKVARSLGIEYHILDLSSKFKEEVYDYFVGEYLNGNTPNPCVKCNRTIKFGALFDFAKEQGADFLATGHYAKTDGEFIYKAEDDTKDQSYFLAQIKQDVLKHLIFPMNKYRKTEIVKLGSTLPVIKEIAKRKESQEICFVENVYTDIIKKHTDIDLPGLALDTDGNEVGHHKGYMHYTIGKRRGFTVHGAHEPHYVKEIDPNANTIVVCKKDDLGVSKVLIDTLNLFIDKKEFECTVKLRYRTHKIACKVIIEDSEAMIYLDKNVDGVATGQVAVFYDGNKVLGSGFIKKTFQ